MRARIPFLSICLFLLIPLSVSAHIVISELLWAGSDLSSADEWIELTAIEDVDSMSGWILTRMKSGEEVNMLTISDDVVMTSGSTLLIANYDANTSRLNTEPDVVNTSISLANTKLLIRLYKPDGSGTGFGLLMDEVDDGIGAPFAGTKGSTGTGYDTWWASMERQNLFGSGSDPLNWYTANTFTGFDDGAPIFGTPGATNGSGAHEDVFAPKDATMLSAEVKSNASSTDSSCHTERNRSAAEVETKCRDESSAQHDTLYITWTPSDSLDLASQKLTWMNSGITLPATATGYQLVNIGTGITFTLQSIDHFGNMSDGIQTISRTKPNVQITEVLANPKGADDEEWIEIANFATEEVDIGGWILDDENSSDEYTIPSPFTLQPNEHRIFSKSITGLPLKNDGELITLSRNNVVMNELQYEETAEEISFGVMLPADRSLGEDAVPETKHIPFCVPTPNTPNIHIAPNPIIFIQSGITSGEGKVTLNFIANVETGSTASAICHWDYGDGYTSSSCNPPSHTISKIGTHVITLTYTSWCGDVIRRTLDVHVVESSTTLQEPSSYSGGGGGGGQRSAGGNPGSGNRTSCTPKHYDGVRISEALPNPEGKDNDGEWIELENTTSETISLCGWMLDDEENGSKPFILDTETIDPLQFLILKRSLTKIALNNDSDSVRLLNPENVVIDEIVFTKGAEGESIARHENGLIGWTPYPTPGFSNQFREKITPGKTAQVQVMDVVDGDTIVVNIDGRRESIRLIGVDTPETVHPFKPIEEYGKEASDFTRTKALHQNITIEFNTGERDKYDRLLAYVILPDGTNLNGEIIRQGYGYAYTKYPFAYSDLFTEYEEEARKAGRGMWKQDDEEVITIITQYIEEKRYVIEENQKDEANENVSSRAQTHDGIESVESGSLTTEITQQPAINTNSNNLSPIINELFPSPHPDHPLGEFIELFNPFDATITLNGWILDDVLNGGSKPQIILNDVNIAAHKHLLLCDGSGCDIPLTITLNNSGDDVVLIAPDGSIASHITYPKLPRDTAYILWNGEWKESLVVTPKERNVLRTRRTNMSSRVAPLDDPSIRFASGKLTREVTSRRVSRDNMKDPLSSLPKRYRNVYATSDEDDDILTSHPILNTLITKKSTADDNALIRYATTLKERIMLLLILSLSIPLLITFTASTSQKMKVVSS